MYVCMYVCVCILQCTACTVVLLECIILGSIMHIYWSNNGDDAKEDDN
jgi:hypothetical protein